jgi:hypothetical protein
MYRYTHQLFLTPNSVYAVVYNVLNREEQTEQELDFWFHSIGQRGLNSVCLLIGTHFDSVDTEQRKQRCLSFSQTIKYRFSSMIRYSIFIDSIADIGMEELAQRLEQIGQKLVGCLQIMFLTNILLTTILF